MKQTKTAKQMQKMLQTSINYDMEYKKIVEVLDKMPILKKLLQNYVLFKDEECADINTPSLVHEYFWLKRKNNLHLLFVQELLDITTSLEGSEWL